MTAMKENRLVFVAMICFLVGVFVGLALAAMVGAMNPNFFK